MAVFNGSVKENLEAISTVQQRQPTVQKIRPELICNFSDH